MRSWLPLGLIAAALVIGGSACGTKQSAEPAGDWMLAFQGDQDGEWGTFAVGLDGGEAVRISGPDLPSEVPPVASPDGKSLILPDPSGGLIVMRADGSGRRRLDAADAAWSPDGTRLAFVPRRGGISISDADGGHVRQVTEAGSSPTWSPDGKQIAFLSDYESGYEGRLLVVDADGGDERELVADGASEPHWSPDGKSISYLDANVERAVFRTVSVDDGLILPSPRLKVDFYDELAWSPDGRHVAFRDITSDGRHSYIAVMKADGSSEPTRLTSEGEWAGAPLWSPDGRSIIYSRNDGLGGVELWEVRLEDRKARRLTELYPNGVNALGSVGGAWIRGPVRAVERPKPMVLAQKDGAVLENPQPIFNLAALGSLVAVVPPDRLFGTVWVLEPPLLLWDPIKGKLDRLSLASCWGPIGVVPMPERVGYSCLGGHAASVNSSVQAFALDTSRPETYFAGAAGDGVPDDALAGRIAGADQFLYFAERKFDSGDVVERKLWRVGPGGKTVIAKGADAGEPAAADGDRLAVERDDGVVAVLDSEGEVLGRLSPGGGYSSEASTWDAYPPATVDLDGPDLVVLRGGALQRYDSRSLKLVRSLPVPADAQLGGLAKGIAAYAASDAVHVVRLDDGAETVLPVRGGHITATDLTTAGLFYAVNTQTVRYGYVQIEKNAPSRIVFVRWDVLLRRLR